MERKYLLIVLFCVGAGLLLLIYWQFPDKDKSLGNAFTVFGTYASVFGIVATYVQVLSLNEMNRKIQAEIENTRRQNENLGGLLDYNGSVKLVQEIQLYLRMDKLESAILRLKDLKLVMIHINHHSAVRAYAHERGYEGIMADMNQDISAINDEILGVKKGLSRSSISQNLDRVEELMIGVQTKLRQEHGQPGNTNAH